jgi:plasmid stabilization system protein ParE
MRRAVFGKQARRDLDDIWFYVPRDSIDAAEKVVDTLERAVRRLAEMPGMGHQRLELAGRRYRVWSVYFLPDHLPIWPEDLDRRPRVSQPASAVPAEVNRTPRAE